MTRLTPNRVFRLVAGDAPLAGQRTTQLWTFVVYRCEVCSNARPETYGRGVVIPASRLLHCRRCETAPAELAL